MSTKEAYVEEHGCSGSCSTCGENCEHKGIQKEKQNKKSNIKKTIAVVSGKGGVGKSFVTSLLASYLNKEGYNVGILDGDIVGPSIPKSFNLHTSAYGDEDQLIVPAVTKSGIKIISTNLMLEHEDDPIIWRGALITSLMRQFYSTVAWGELDVLLIDMPPGTGDVALIVIQSLPITGMIMVSVPQDMISMIVAKGVNMARKLNVNIFVVDHKVLLTLIPFICSTCGSTCDVCS